MCNNPEAGIVVFRFACSFHREMRAPEGTGAAVCGHHDDVMMMTPAAAVRGGAQAVRRPTTKKTKDDHRDQDGDVDEDRPAAVTNTGTAAKRCE